MTKKRILYELKMAKEAKTFYMPKSLNKYVTNGSRPEETETKRKR